MFTTHRTLIFALTKRMIFWLKINPNTVGFLFGSGLFWKMLSSISPAVAAPRSDFPPDGSFIRRPFRWFKSLALEFLLAHRCGREEGVGLRSRYHPTSDLPSPTRKFSSPSSPVSDSHSVRRCGWQDILSADPLLSAVRLLVSLMLSLTWFLCPSTVAAPESLSHP